MVWFGGTGAVKEKNKHQKTLPPSDATMDKIPEPTVKNFDMTRARG